MLDVVHLLSLQVVIGCSGFAFWLLLLLRQQLLLLYYYCCCVLLQRVVEVITIVTMLG